MARPSGHLGAQKLERGLKLLSVVDRQIVARACGPEVSLDPLSRLHA